ncbi:hypothetical protein HN51_065683 [Arachis hypogaea]
MVQESSYAPEDRLLRAILGIQVSSSKETCLKLPIGGRGRVVDVRWIQKNPPCAGPDLTSMAQASQVIQSYGSSLSAYGEVRHANVPWMIHISGSGALQFGNGTKNS